MIFERLKNSLRLIEARACDINQQFIELAHFPEVCIAQALTNYFISSTAVPLMTEVIRCAELRPEDPTSAPLIKYMQQHIAEETDHDLWVLDDLEVFGIPRETVFKMRPSSNIATLVGTQYYMMRHQHPIAFMGYLACLETHHPTIEYVDYLIKQSGLPAKGFSTLRHHAELDVHHSRDIIDTINALPMTEEQYLIMEQSAFQTYRYVAFVMEDVCKAAPKVA